MEDDEERIGIYARVRFCRILIEIVDFFPCEISKKEWTIPWFTRRSPRSAFSNFLRLQRDELQEARELRRRGSLRVSLKAFVSHPVLHFLSRGVVAARKTYGTDDRPV